MADPWDDDLEQTMQQGDPWDDDLAATDASTPSKSAKVAKNLSIFGGRFDPVGAAETILAVGSGMASEGAKGLAGIAGTVAGMWPGGESPNEKGNRYLEAVPDFGYEPKTQGGQAGQEMLNAGMEKGLEGAKFVGSGYAGLGAMAAGADATEATQSMQDFKETPNAMGEGVFEHTQSPTMAVVAQLLPEVAATLSPIKKPKLRTPRPEMAPDMPPSGFGGVGDVEVPRGTREIPPTGPGGRPIDSATANVFDQLREAIRIGDKAKIMELTKANPAIVAAFEQLDIDFTPGAVSESMPLRQTEAALGSKVDSNIPTMHKQMEVELNQAAKDLIDEAGGDYGRASNVASDIETRFNELEANYIKQGDEVWKLIDEQVKAKGVDAMPVDAQSAANQVRRSAENAGRNGDIDDGLKRLSRQERELFEMTHQKVPVERKRMHEGKEITETVDEWQYTEPKYSAIDRFRRSLLEGQNGVGPFRAESPGRLKMLYGQMAEIQARVAKGNGYGDLWETGNNLIKDRKLFEEGMQRTLGRGLSQSVLTRLSSATNALLKNDVKKWDQLMKDLPADTRAMAAAQALENVFFTAGKGTKMSDSFVRNFERIKRDPAIRDRLLGDMTPENRATFMALGDAASGFYRMMDKALSNPSGTGVTNYVLRKLEEPGFMQNVLGGFADRATGRLPIIRDWAQTVLRRTPEQQTAQAAGRLNAAANLLTDPALRRAIVEYANGSIEAANKILQDSQTWAEWVKLQPIPAQERLMSAGIVALFEEDNEE